MKITFFGATQEVTGSRYLVEHEDTKILVDCGLFQGKEEIRRHNRDAFPIDPGSIDALVLTHAHIDHTGYIPVLVKNGFKGTIYCSKPTYDLSALLLVDSGYLQEEEAREARKRGNAEVAPLYTVQDAKNSLPFFKPTEYEKNISLGSLTIKLINSGHILGASFVEMFDGKRTLTFSGDLGRPHQLLMKAPPPIQHTDFLVLEATYGNRLHPIDDPFEVLSKAVNTIMEKGGKLLIPAFAVGRAQAILYCLYQLKQKKRIPDIPVFLDSPLSSKVTTLFCTYNNELRLPSTVCDRVFGDARYIRTVEQSKAVDRVQGPVIIISASGMATGGRVTYHIKEFVADDRNVILFVGFQAEGTLGRVLLDGAQEIKLYGQRYKVRAAIEILKSLSAHADYNEILAWLATVEKAPKKVFLTHGEKEAAESLQKKIEERFGWDVAIPRLGESFDLSI